jgi:hypothetical protein
MTATPPTRINLPPRVTPSDLFNPSPNESPSNPSGSYPNRRVISRSLRPSFSTAAGRTRKVSRATLRGLEDLGMDDDEEGTKLPTLVPGIRPAYSTPLPVLPMIVLCIVGDCPDSLTIVLMSRQCCLSYYRRTCARHSYYQW